MLVLLAYSRDMECRRLRCLHTENGQPDQSHHCGICARHGIAHLRGRNCGDVRVQDDAACVLRGELYRRRAGKRRREYPSARPCCIAGRSRTLNSRDSRLVRQVGVAASRRYCCQCRLTA